MPAATASRPSRAWVRAAFTRMRSRIQSVASSAIRSARARNPEASLRSPRFARWNARSAKASPRRQPGMRLTIAATRIGWSSSSMVLAMACWARARSLRCSGCGISEATSKASSSSSSRQGSRGASAMPAASATVAEPAAGADAGADAGSESVSGPASSAVSAPETSLTAAGAGSRCSQPTSPVAEASTRHEARSVQGRRTSNRSMGRGRSQKPGCSGKPGGGTHASRRRIVSSMTRAPEGRRSGRDQSITGRGRTPQGRPAGRRSRSGRRRWCRRRRSGRRPRARSAGR